MNVSPYHVANLQFSDGQNLVIHVPEGKTVLEAALEKGIPILHQCRSGICSSCSATIREGRAGFRVGASSTLSRSEFEAGRRLLCVTEMQTDCTFILNYGSDAGRDVPVFAHAFVNSVERLVPNVIRLTLELADGEWINFKSGQFLNVRVPGTSAVRSYSPASTPAHLPQIVLLVRLLPDGVMSEYLRERVKPDDVIEIEGPFGSFFLREKRQTPHIMIAGGTGLAPIMSMIDSLRTSSGRRNNILLNFGCRTPDDVFCQEEIALRKLWLPNLQARISVRHDARDDFILGNPFDTVYSTDIHNPDTVVYLCGSPPMVEGALSKLKGIGIKSDNIFTEHFTETKP